MENEVKAFVEKLCAALDNAELAEAIKTIVEDDIYTRREGQRYSDTVAGTIQLISDRLDSELYDWCAERLGDVPVNELATKINELDADKILAELE